MQDRDQPTFVLEEINKELRRGSCPKTGMTKGVRGGRK